MSLSNTETFHVSHGDRVRYETGVEWPRYNRTISKQVDMSAMLSSTYRV